MDEVQVTFWGDNLFVGKNGKSIPNGVTIKKEVVRQVDPQESVRIVRFARILGYFVLLMLVFLLIVAHVTKSDTYPIWANVNMLFLVTHFPLLYLQLPGGISLFMKEFLNVLRLQDLQLQQFFFSWWKVTSIYDKAFLADKGFNIYFDQLGYNSKYIIFNCANIIFLIVLWTFICLVTYVVEFAKSRRSRGFRNLEKPNFGHNGRVKQYRSNSFHIALQGLLRIMQVSFIEVFLFTLVNMREFGGESDLAKASRAVNIALIVAYVGFFLFIPIYRIFAQKYFTVTSIQGAHAMKQAKSKLARDKRRAERMRQLQDYEDQSPDAKPEDEEQSMNQSMNSSVSSNAPVFKQRARR